LSSCFLCFLACSSSDSLFCRRIQRGQIPFWNKAYLLDEESFNLLVSFMDMADKDAFPDFGFSLKTRESAKDKKSKETGDGITYTGLQNFFNLPFRPYQYDVITGLNDGSTLTRALSLFKFKKPNEEAPLGIPHAKTSKDRYDRKLLRELCNHIAE
jgi:hypothetical protein